VPSRSPVNALIVDDDRSTQRVLADALTKQGFVVTVERDGEWAVKTFEKKKFDVVILDLLLPAISGYEVAKKIRAMPRGRKVPIIMISGVYKNAIHQREAVQKHGAFAFIEKPIDLPRLAHTLKEALGDRFPRRSRPKPPPPPIDEDDEKTGEFMADDAQREEVQVVEKTARSVAAATAGLVLRGTFDAGKNFPEVLAEIARWKASGALLLRRAKVKKIVYFRDGVPELVKSNLLVECLGQILVREKLISQSECEESLRRMKKTGRMQGTVLIDMGCISPHNLQYALSLQLQEKLYDAFKWEDGEYQLNPRVTPPAEPVTLGMTTAQLILQGIKQTWDTKRLRRAFHGSDAMYVHPSQDPLYALQDAGLNDEEKELVMMCDGHKTVATLRALDIMPHADTDRLLYSLICAQMLELKPTAAPGKPKPSIARIAEMAPPKVSVPPPLPRAPATGGPPPLPPRSSLPPVASPPVAKAPVLDMPWPDAPLAQPMVRPEAPPPPPPASPPRKKRPPTKEISAPQLAKAMGSLLPELSAVVSTSRLSNEESIQREQLAAKMAAMRRLDYFEILGVKRKASREEIKRAYFALAKEYHPDRHFQSASAEIRQLAQQLYDLISTAHDTLTDPSERDRYVAELEAGVPREQNDNVGKILAAEGLFQRGEDHMRNRDFAEAYRHFSDAIAMYDEEGEFHAWQGWSLFQADPSRSEEAITAIEKAVSLNPRLDKSYLFLGYIHKATGRPDKAMKQFEKAIQSNPDCTEALRELRLLGKQRR